LNLSLISNAYKFSHEKGEDLIILSYVLFLWVLYLLNNTYNIDINFRF